MDEEKIIEKIKTFAIEIYETLGAGYDESVYEEAMAIEMRNAKLFYDTEYNTEIIYKGEKVGIHRLDFVIEKTVVIELKAVGSITKGHRSQIASYLKTLGLKNGLLINFPDTEKDTPDFEEIKGGKIKQEVKGSNKKGN